MKNPHGVEPTRFIKRKESNCAIECDSVCGPIFGYYSSSDIHITNNCNNNSNNKIGDPSHFQYECHPQYRSSLYVNTAGPDSTNYFSVLDYEVFTPKKAQVEFIW